MKVDLAAAAKSNATTGGSARAPWTGGVIEIDDSKMLDLIVRAVAYRMGHNLFNGLRPDGRGGMPGRKRDGQPRGLGAAIARNLLPVKVGRLVWIIAAHREKPGHLARIMGGIPLLAPPIDTIRAAVHAAFVASVKVSAQKAASAGLSTKLTGSGTAARAARASARSEARGLRAERDTAFGGFGGTRSGLGKRISSASRRAVRRSLVR